MLNWGSLMCLLNHMLVRFKGPSQEITELTEETNVVVYTSPDLVTTPPLSPYSFNSTNLCPLPFGLEGRSPKSESNIRSMYITYVKLDLYT